MTWLVYISLFVTGFLAIVSLVMALASRREPEIARGQKSDVAFKHHAKFTAKSVLERQPEKADKDIGEDESEEDEEDIVH